MQEMQEAWVWSLGQEDSLEELMGTHASILAGKMPWTEEPGRLQFMGLRRVEHDWSDWAHTHPFAIQFKNHEFWNNNDWM